MFFSNYLEFSLIILFIIFYNGLRWLAPGLIIIRKLSLLAGSLVVLYTLLDFFTILVLLAVMVMVYFASYLLLKSELSKNNKKKLLFFCLFVLLVLFCIRNYTWISEGLTAVGLQGMVSRISLVGRIGLSYILFRVIHYLVDAYRLIFKEISLVTFLNYIFFFPSFLSGPIDRYQNFSYWQNHQRSLVSRDMFLQGMGRVFIGSAKKFILVPIIVPFTNDYSVYIDFVTTWQWQLVLSVLAYTFYIYFDFSGYSDIAIGTAYLIGIRSPENFNNPYVSLDISEFWKRWHISFSSILGEYFFKPFVTGLSARFKSAPRLLVSVIGYLYTFTICGLWHGSSLNFIYWGLWHGVGLSIYKLWSNLNLTVNRNNGYFKPIRTFSSMVLTFLFVSSGWYFFMTKTNEIHSVLKNQFALINSDYRDLSEKSWRLENKLLQGKGWGIELSSKHGNMDNVEIEYKFIGDEIWQKYSTGNNLSGNKVFILGKAEYDGLKENLEPALYAVRIKLEKENQWYGQIVQVDNYKLQSDE